MDKRKLISTLLLIPFLGGCCWFKKKDTRKPLEIPPVDVLSMTLTLPQRQSSSGNIYTKDGYEYLDIYELSDFHGAVNYKEGENIGLAKLSTFLKKKRQENPGGTIVVSSGDMFQGSCESNLTRGYMVNYAMNYMDFDAMAVGNHEFDWTETWLKNNAELSYNGHITPMLGSNIVYKSNNQRPDYLKASTIITRGDYKIGIIGSIGDKLKSSILRSSIEPFDFINEVDAVNSEAAALKASGCNFVIWNSHNSVDYLHDEVSSISNVDICFGGHAHQDDMEFGTTPKIIATKNNGGSIGYASLKINKSTKQLEDVYIDHLSLNEIDASSLEEDPNVKSIMNQYNVEIDKVKNIKLGSTDGDLHKSGELCNLCTKSMYDSAAKFLNDNPQYGISKDSLVAAFHNGVGGVRAEIKKGDIYYSNVYQACPFDNELVLKEIKGYQISDQKFHNFGIYHPGKTSDIQSSQKYYIVLNDFIATSTLHYNDDELVRTGLILRDELAKYIYQEENIKVSSYEVGTENFSHYY